MKLLPDQGTSDIALKAHWAIAAVDIGSGSNTPRGWQVRMGLEGIGNDRNGRRGMVR